MAEVTPNKITDFFPPSPKQKEDGIQNQAENGITSSLSIKETCPCIVHVVQRFVLALKIKKKKNQINILHILAQNIDCKYLIEPPHCCRHFEILL